jgi:beta-glucosidase
MTLNRQDFGDDFRWGVATAAYQIEGAHLTDGKGPSIWDVFVQKNRKIADNHNGNVTCNFYSHYQEDIALMYRLGIPNFRFSLSWSRILPQGIGPVNHKGVDFYNRMIDWCLELGIEPWVTLYHWDLPQALQQKGGWTNREILHWFSFYADFCIRKFGDRVRHWMVLNEPMVFTGAGYFLGVHAPGKKGLANFLAAVHHATLCQAEVGRLIKNQYPNSKVGTTFSYSHIDPNTPTERDIIAARKVDALLNRMFLEPLLGLGYPVKDLPILNRIERFVHPADYGKLAFDMDFIGLQNYTREIVEHSAWTPFVKARIIPADKRSVIRTLMNWEVYPDAIYNALVRLGKYPQIKEIIVTENGAAFNDVPVNGEVYDRSRMLYLEKHIAQVLRARRDGVNVSGYFVWTLMDNFEWAEGFHPRFGLVYVDFESQQRIVKRSGQWYSDFLRQEFV